MHDMEEIELWLRMRRCEDVTIRSFGDDIKLLNAYTDKLEICVEYIYSRFGLVIYDKNSHPLEGLFDSPEDWYDTKKDLVRALEKYV